MMKTGTTNVTTITYNGQVIEQRHFVFHSQGFSKVKLFIFRGIIMQGCRSCSDVSPNYGSTTLKLG